ncbi:MAG: hypothetical protein LBD21_00940 [Tannerellaceae bacterium]|jgi:hypothetical protein|nr:hypothetical protein [Tannerellaceae bacterium]
MKQLQMILLTTGVVLFLALAGCGGSNGDGPEVVPPPADTVVTEPPDTIIMPSIYRYEGLIPRLNSLGCMNNTVVKNATDRTGDDGIVGKWKLLLTHDPCTTYLKASTDYSCRTVLYEFDADSTLTVISDTTAIPSGKFKYTFGEVSHEDYMQLEVSIDGRRFSCESLSADMLAYYGSYFHEDGVTRICALRVFRKIKQ